MQKERHDSLRILFVSALVFIAIALLGWSQPCRGGSDSETSSPAVMPQASPKPVQPENASNRSAAPGFTLQSLKGQTVHLSDYKGRVVLVDFWATWCGPCRVSIPDLISLYDSYNKSGFDILGISLERKGTKALEPFVSQNKIRYPILIGDRDVVTKYGGISAIPTSFLIGRDGTIREQWVGTQPRDIIEKAVKILLKEQAPG